MNTLNSNPNSNPDSIEVTSDSMSAPFSDVPTSLALREDVKMPQQVFSNAVADVMESSDFKIPRIRLAQGQTPEVVNSEARPGQFLFEGMDPSDSLAVIPVLCARTRQYQKPNPQGDKIVVCKSNDTIVGEGTPGGACATCPLSQWSKAPDGKNTPPQCDIVYTYQVWIPAAQSIGLLVLKGTSTDAARKINTYARTNNGRLGGFGIVLTSSKQTKGRNTWFTMNVALSKEVTQDQLDDAAAAFNIQ